MSLEPDAPSAGAHDSAGVPWAGRSFEPNRHAADDGAAPPAFLAAHSRFRAGDADADVVVDALRDTRLLIPLVAELGEAAEGPHGQPVDKSQELSIVTVAAPDGRPVMPAFSDVEAMRRWDAQARPIPTPVVLIARAAVEEGTDLVVVDPGSETEFVVRRPAVWAVARGEVWQPAHRDPVVRLAFLESIASELAVLDAQLESADPASRLRGPELRVRLQLVAGLTRDELDTVLARLAQRWAADDRIATGVDSLEVKLEASA